MTAGNYRAAGLKMHQGLIAKAVREKLRARFGGYRFRRMSALNYTVAAMDHALAAGKKLKVLILTNCTYDGLIYDIAEIVKEAHKRKIMSMRPGMGEVSSIFLSVCHAGRR